MNKDIVLDLQQKIVNEYQKLIKENDYINHFQNKLKSHKVNGEDVSLYGNELGACASKSFLKYVTKENLPDGKLYWNIAERLIVLLLKDVYEKVNEAADIVQKRDDEANNINIKPQRATFPEERVHDLIQKAIQIFESEE